MRSSVTSCLYIIYWLQRDELVVIYNFLSWGSMSRKYARPLTALEVLEKIFEEEDVSSDAEIDLGGDGGADEVDNSGDEKGDDSEWEYEEEEEVVSSSNLEVLSNVAVLSSTVIEEDNGDGGDILPVLKNIPVANDNINPVHFDVDSDASLGCRGSGFGSGYSIIFGQSTSSVIDYTTSSDPPPINTSCSDNQDDIVVLKNDAPMKKRCRTRGGYRGRGRGGKANCASKRNKVQPEPDSIGDHSDIDIDDNIYINDIANDTAKHNRRGNSSRARRGKTIPRQPAGNVENTNWEYTNTFTPRDIPFTETERLLCRLPPSPTPLDFVDCYLTPELYDILVTNRYASQFIRDNPNSPVCGSWKDVTANEMKTFLGVILLMGIIYKPRLKMYWSTDNLYYTPIFSAVMNRDRFFTLLRFFSF